MRYSRTSGEELREFRLLYKELVDRLIPVEEQFKEEREAVEGRDEIADEKELMKALGKTDIRH